MLQAPRNEQDLKDRANEWLLANLPVPVIKTAKGFRQADPFRVDLGVRWGVLTGKVAIDCVTGPTGVWLLSVTLPGTKNSHLNINMTWEREALGNHYPDN
ncbi:hypothetical protein LCGC14_1570010 [marine sediment metagenome]|uniref:Uncharacterized protein n=1 Tax=marine sediment metagenome TaxID=412755 RepID=A0A0F9IK28_9ZZZZ